MPCAVATVTGDQFVRDVFDLVLASLPDRIYGGARFAHLPHLRQERLEPDRRRPGDNKLPEAAQVAELGFQLLPKSA
jgi:hypothetical protein